MTPKNQLHPVGAQTPDASPAITDPIPELVGELVEPIVAGLTAQLYGSPTAVSAPERKQQPSPTTAVSERTETAVEREERLGQFRVARNLRREIARRARQFTPPTTRIRRRVFVDGQWVLAHQQAQGSE